MSRVLALAAMILLSACASITTGTEQTVFVETQNVSGASCKLTDSKFAEWTVASTPGTARVRKGDGPMNVVCNKTGYEPGTALIQESFVAATLGNVLIGGGIGLLIDASSGAAQKYPDRIMVNMIPLTGEAAKAAAVVAAREEKAKKQKPPPKRARRQLPGTVGDRRPPKKGFYRLKTHEIRLIFKDNRIDNYPDRWLIEFTPDGKWEGTKYGSRMIHGYGTWTARKGMHCLVIDDHDAYAYENVEPGSCYEVWIDEHKALVRMVDPRDRGHPIIAKEDAFAEVGLLLNTIFQASGKPSVKKSKKATTAVEAGRRPLKKGFRRLNTAEIKALFKDTFFENYPNHWQMDFKPNGKWEGQQSNWSVIEGYGTWTVKNGLHCRRVTDTSSTWNNVETDACYQVWVDEATAKVRMIDQFQNPPWVLAKENAYGAIDRMIYATQ